MQNYEELLGLLGDAILEALSTVLVKDYNIVSGQGF